MRNKLTINDEKANFILFHTVNNPTPSNFNTVDTDVMTIECVPAFTYLGVYIYIDEILHWSEHVNYLCSSLVKYFGKFRHIRYEITSKLSRGLYCAFIYSKSRYGIDVYGSCLNVKNDEEAKRAGGCFNIKMSSYQYRESHCGDLHNGISYTGKMASLYWINPQLVTSPSLSHMVVCTDNVVVTNVHERWAAPCDQQFTLSCVSKEHPINQLKDVSGLAPQ